MNPKQSGWGFLFWAACFVGLCGLHRFYLRRYATGFLWLITFGLLGVGQFIDLFLINGMVERENREDAAEFEIDRALLRGLARRSGG